MHILYNGSVMIQMASMEEGANAYENVETPENAETRDVEKSTEWVSQ